MSVFSERLKFLIDDFGLNHKDVAEGIGIKPYVLSSFIHGKSEPDLKTLIKIVEYFGVTADFLVGSQDDIISPEIRDAVHEFKTEVIDCFNRFSAKCEAIRNKLKENE